MSVFKTSFAQNLVSLFGVIASHMSQYSTTFWGTRSTRISHLPGFDFCFKVTHSFLADCDIVIVVWHLFKETQIAKDHSLD